MTSGCIAAAVGGEELYKKEKAKEQSRQEFMDKYNNANAEREKAGLQPLDLCTEQYYFNENWAKEDIECKDRIERYEAGDTTAIGTQQLGIDEEPDITDQSE